MESYVKRTQRDYSMTFKLSVVGQVERGEMTYSEATKFYGIQGKATVLTWIRKHGSVDWCKLKQPAIQPNTGSIMTGIPSGLSPEQRIKALEVALREANQKAQLFESIVEVIRTQYGASGAALVKKSSGRPCKPSKLTKP